MKKFLITALTFCLALILCLGAAGCGVFKPAVKDPNNGEGPGGGDEPIRETTVYTATLVYDGERYLPETPMSATWTDGESIYTADFNERGVATVEGLDGDYKVTVSGIPEGYTYNPNGYMADGEDNKDIFIELLRLKEGVGKGTGWYSGEVLMFMEKGVYRLKFDKPGQEIKCRYSTSENGNYIIESIVDTTPNEYNPRIDVYYGSAVFVNPEPTVTINDGGASSAFTKNFVYNVGTDGKGGVFSFAVKCSSRHNEYPAYIDIRISREGDYIDQSQTISMVFPKVTFEQTPNYPGYTFVNAGKRTHHESICSCSSSCQCWSGGNCSNDECNCVSTVLSGSNIRYSDPLDGGDGYYHLLNDDGTISDTILYAKIKGSNPIVNFYDNYQVSLNFGGKSYVYLMRGYSHVVVVDGGQSDIGYLGVVGGESKIPEGHKPYLEKLNCKSYVDYVNSDGVYGVTQEIKDFLQGFSVTSSYFMDGDGYAEGIGFSSTYADQWLFGCGYYVKN